MKIVKPIMIGILISSAPLYAHTVRCNNIYVDSIDQDGKFLNIRKGPAAHKKRVGVIPNNTDSMESHQDYRIDEVSIGKRVIENLSIELIASKTESHWLKVRTSFTSYRVKKNQNERFWHKTDHKFKGWVSGKKLGWVDYPFLLNETTRIYKDSSATSGLVRPVDKDATNSHTSLQGIYGCKDGMIKINQSPADSEDKIKGWVHAESTRGDAQY
jgi:hypothetical protein